VALEVPPQEYEAYVAEPLRGLYTAGVDALLYPALSDWRRSVVDAALREHLLPAALADLRRELAAAAARAVALEYEDAFWREATTPPLRLKAIDDEARGGRFAAAAACALVATGWPFGGMSDALMQG
jgi:hypothetical protein